MYVHCGRTICLPFHGGGSYRPPPSCAVLYAIRDIAKDEELTYDYNFELESDQQKRIRCSCKSELCFGWLN